MKSKESQSNTFWASVVSVLTGTAVAQAIPLIRSLAIARLSIPAEFVVFAMWFVIVSI